MVEAVGYNRLIAYHQVQQIGFLKQKKRLSRAVGRQAKPVCVYILFWPVHNWFSLSLYIYYITTNLSTLMFMLHMIPLFKFFFMS